MTDPTVPTLHGSFRILAVVADAHLDAGDEAGLNAFEEWVEAISSRVDGLVILGDLFEIWVGFPHLMEAHHRRILACLSRAASSGLRIAYVEGNRDFFISSIPSTPFEIVCDSLHVEAAGHAVWLAHGDRINEDDVQYRAWRAFSLCPPVRWLARVFPGFLGRPLLRRIDHRFRSTNTAQKASFPEASLKSYLHDRRLEGADLVVLGHFHQKVTLVEEGSELRILPAWMNSGEWLQIEEAGVQLWAVTP